MDEGEEQTQSADWRADAMRRAEKANTKFRILVAMFQMLTQLGLVFAISYPTLYDDFLRFIQEKADVWIGLPGQVKELDALAKEFASAKDKAAVIKKAEKVSVDEKDADSAKYYVKVMTKASDAADFVTKETARLKKMMDDGSVKAEKKSQFGRRLNMLSSFA